MSEKLNWFQRLIAFWDKNLLENYKQVSVGFGVMLVLILASLIPPVSAIMNGSVADWGTFGTVSFTAIISFLSLLVYSFFGKKGENGVAPKPPP